MSAGSNNLKSALSAELEADTRVLAVYLHGSRVKGQARADSDMDCAILPFPGVEPVSALELMRMTGELSARLGVRLDLGVLSFQNLVYFIQAVYHGERIFCRDEALADALVTRAFSLYARLREDRKEVEAAYHVA